MRTPCAQVCNHGGESLRKKIFGLSLVDGVLDKLIVEGESKFDGEIVIMAMLLCESNDSAGFSSAFDASSEAAHTGEY